MVADKYSHLIRKIDFRKFEIVLQRQGYSRQALNYKVLSSVLLFLRGLDDAGETYGQVIDEVRNQYFGNDRILTIEFVDLATADLFMLKYIEDIIDDSGS